jgi:hypothetical protein
MNQNENWANLPSPIPEKLWGDTFTNPRQKVLNDEARNVFEKGLKSGYISQKNGRFYAGVTPLFNSTTREEAEDFFIRCPNLIKQVKNTADTHKENDQTEDFLRVLVCEAIVKRGALYLFEKELEDDPWPPFVNLIENAEYPEFAMFNSYKSLPQNRKKTLKSKAKFHEEKWPEDKLVINLKKWQGKIAVRKNQLDTEYKHHSKEIYTFYRNALLRLNTQISALAG